MVSLVSLPAELLLNVIENFEHSSYSFIPAPPQELLRLSRVCRVLRALVLPVMLQSVTLLNEEKSGSSVLAILNSPYREHVRQVHYIGVMSPTPEDDDPVKPVSAEYLPESVEQVLSNLEKLPNLQRAVMEFRCSKNEDDDIKIYEGSFWKIYWPDREEGGTAAFRSLMERSYRALARNPTSTINHLELKNVMGKKCSAWKLPEFVALLGGLTSFTMSLRGGYDDDDYHINVVEDYLDFIEDLDTCFFQYLSQVQDFDLAGSEHAPPGIPEGLHIAALKLLEGHMPKLQNLTLHHVFISSGLAAFITNHSSTLESVRLIECYSGHGKETEQSWGEFFVQIASEDMKRLCVFDVGSSDLERLREDNKVAWDYHKAQRGEALRQQFPERRMFDYKSIDWQFGDPTDAEDEAFGQFESGSDHQSWIELCRIVKRNSDVWFDRKGAVTRS